jgi:hypothetical protein
VPYGRLFACLALTSILAGCAEDTPAPAIPRTPLVVRPKAATFPTPAEWSYWDPIEPALREDVPRVQKLPLTETQVTRPQGVKARWDALSPAARELFAKNGFLAVDPGKIIDDDGDTPTLDELYEQLEKQRVPTLLTLDALLFLTQAAVDRAAADHEELVLEPALKSLLKSLDGALAIQEKSVPHDLVEALRLARGFVAVAASLALPGYSPPAELAPGVGEELRRIRAHAGTERSPLFGVTLDYASFAPSHALRPNDDVDRAHIAMAQAATWLAQAPFLMASRGDTQGSPVDVQTARVHTRAALLLGHLLDPRVSKERAEDFAKLTRAFAFVSGAPDDPLPTALVDVATSVGVSLDSPTQLANVAKLDRVRHSALERFQAGGYDGVASLRVGETSKGATSAGVGRAALGVRFLGSAAPADSLVLQGLVFPYVGTATKEASGVTQLSGQRAFGVGTDVAAWLGSREADKLRHEAGDDAFAGFQEARARTDRLRPEPLAPARHASLHMSTLDVLATYLAPSRAELSLPASFSAAYARHKVEVVLGAWAHERHDARPFARAASYTTTTPKPRPKLEIKDVPVFVEPHPEALGHLLAYVRQASRGLTAQGLPRNTSGAIALTELEDLVDAAYQTATRAANDEPPTLELSSRLAGFSDRLEWLHALTGLRTGGVLAAHVHADAVSGRASVAGIGGLGELHVAIREPRTGNLVHAVGARFSGLEAVWPRNKSIHDGALKQDLGKSPLAPPPWVSAYLVK